MDAPDLPSFLRPQPLAAVARPLPQAPAPQPWALRAQPAWARDTFRPGLPAFLRPAPLGPGPTGLAPRPAGPAAPAPAMAAGPWRPAPQAPAPAAPPALASVARPQPLVGPARSSSGALVNPVGPGRGFPEAGPWMTFYGAAQDLGDLRAVAAKHRVINLDADPGVGNFTPAQIQELKAGGRNRVLSYLNLGAAESFRDHWAKAPAGLLPAGQNRAAQLGAYEGYADERWMDPGNPAWRALVLEHIVPRLVAQGVDGFYLDNLELLSHGADAGHRPLSAASVQAGLDLVRELRERYPNLLIVLQNGTGPTTLHGRTGGRPFAELLDGVAHESLFTQPSSEGDARRASYRVERDEEALAEMRAWKALSLKPGGRPFHLSAQEYLGSRPDSGAMARVKAQAAAEGFALHVGDRSAGMQTRAAVGLQEGP